jgi:DNA-binding CsgD family transcriptional regulator
MRVLIVGSPSDRARLRVELDGSGLEIVGEVSTLGAARAADVDADAIVVAWATGEDHDSHGERAERDADAAEYSEALTAREIEVLELLAEGLANKAIAARLGISDQTVKFHVASISGKLGAANRTDTVRRAVRRGLITL